MVLSSQFVAYSSKPACPSFESILLQPYFCEVCGFDRFRLTTHYLELIHQQICILRYFVSRADLVRDHLLYIPPSISRRWSSKKLIELSLYRLQHGFRQKRMEGYMFLLLIEKAANNRTNFASLNMLR